MLHLTLVNLYHLGGTAFQEGDYAAAQALWEECREVERRNRTRGSSVLGRLAEVATVQGDTAGARVRWEESLAEGQELGRRDFVAYALLGLGTVARLEGDGAGAGAGVCAGCGPLRVTLLLGSHGSGRPGGACSDRVVQADKVMNCPAPTGLGRPRSAPRAVGSARWRHAWLRQTKRLASNDEGQAY